MITNLSSPEGLQKPQLAPAADGIQPVAAGDFLPMGEKQRREAIALGFRSKRLANNAVRFLLECQRGA